MNEEKRKVYIPVVDCDLRPCWPTYPWRVPVLLKTGRATIFSRNPFILRLTYPRDTAVDEYTERLMANLVDRALKIKQKYKKLQK